MLHHNWQSSIYLFCLLNSYMCHWTIMRGSSGESAQLHGQSVNGVQSSAGVDRLRSSHCSQPVWPGYTLFSALSTVLYFLSQLFHWTTWLEVTTDATSSILSVLPVHGPWHCSRLIHVQLTLSEDSSFSRSRKNVLEEKIKARVWKWLCVFYQS